MTLEQKLTIEKSYNGFLKNMDRFSGYNPQSFCVFKTYRNDEDPEDNSILIVQVIITALSDDFQPFTTTNYVRVEPDGTEYPLNYFYTDTQVLNYMERLTKFDWNG
jgi:hypothetical protein